MKKNPSDETQHIVKILASTSRADWFSMWLEKEEVHSLRCAQNQVSTCGSESNTTLRLISAFGQRSAQVTTTDLSVEGIRAATLHSEELARTSSENPELMPPLPPDSPPGGGTEFDPAVADVTFGEAAQMISAGLTTNRSHALNTASFFQWGKRYCCFANSNKLFAEHDSTFMALSVTARSADQKHSSKHYQESFSRAGFNPEYAYERAVHDIIHEKSLGERQELPPGDYTTILAPSACFDIVGCLVASMDRRTADEGRSYFSDTNGRSRIGQRLFPDSINIRSSPRDEQIPTRSFTTEGMAVEDTTWIEAGRLMILPTSRYWASKSKLSALAAPLAVRMSGGENSLEQLIQSTERGVLVSNVWYIRMVDPQKILVTGLTRDGTYLIEDGVIKAPIKNFRFNVSPVEVLQNTEALSASVIARGNEHDSLRMCVPGLKTRDFHFTSISDAI